MHSDFDPDSPGSGAGLYGLPFRPETALIHIQPVPWEATASYGRGTRRGPEAIFRASQQVDLFDLDFGEPWRQGMVLLDEDPRVAALAEQAEADALANIAALGEDHAAAARVNALSAQLNALVYARAAASLAAGKVAAVLGGDHSTPYGLHQAVAEVYPGVGFLHLDAHADLRDAYLGFRWSHASIFHNSLQFPGVSRLVGVGYRDVGAAEVQRIRTDDRITAFFDRDLARRRAGGQGWLQTVDEIVAALPPQVHVSFDIDGLDPTLCPNTGTPVAGGLGFQEAVMLLQAVSEQREIVGFDLCEVGVSPVAGDAPTPAEEWDANVGARVLYKLIGAVVASRR